MSVGASVVIANIFGSGKKEKLKNAIHTAIGLSFLGGIVLFIFITSFKMILDLSF